MNVSRNQVVIYEFTRAEIVEILRQHTDAIIPETGDPRAGVQIRGLNDAISIEIVYRGAVTNIVAETGETDFLAKRSQGDTEVKS